MEYTQAELDELLDDAYIKGYLDGQEAPIRWTDDELEAGYIELAKAKQQDDY